MSHYGAALYGVSRYGEQVTPFSGGSRFVSAKLYRATIGNKQVEDISDRFLGGRVDFSLDRDVRMRASLTIRGETTLNPYTDYLAPYIHFIGANGVDYGLQQLGLYAIRVPPGTRWKNDAVFTVTGEDLVSVLMNSAYSDTDNVAASTVVTTEMRAVIEEAGLVRHAVSHSARVMPFAMTAMPGVSRLDKLNRLAEIIGYYSPYADLSGKIVSPGVYQSPIDREPGMTLTMSDVGRMGTGGPPSIEIQPTDQVPRNVVIVIKDNPSSAPLVGIARNTLASSPSSINKTGIERVRVEKTTDAETQADVDALAARLLKEERLRYQTIRFDAFTTWIPEAYDVVQLDLNDDLTDLAGAWAVRNWSMGFTPDDAILSVEASQTRNERGVPV